MLIPTKSEADLLLAQAGRLNPGPWVEHSLSTGRAAQAIAGRHPDLDSDAAYVLGCLHDIGRREGRTDMRHCLDGYTFLLECGWKDAARICLTHSFPYKHIDAVFGSWDCTGQEKQFVADYLAGTEYTLYDKLIQLCDALAVPSGFTLMEKRMLEVALRRGTNQYTVAKWKETFAIKAEMERTMGASIYKYLPGVVENTFLELPRQLEEDSQ